MTTHHIATRSQNTYPRHALSLLIVAAVCSAGVRAQGATYRVSLGPVAQQANGRSAQPSTSGAGLIVAFSSQAADLVAGDSNGYADIFVNDIITGQTRRVSVTSSGGQANGTSFDPEVSADGRWVTFVSEASNLTPGDTNSEADVFVHDLVTGQTRRVNVSSTGAQADMNSGEPTISGNGRFVAFSSHATNLVAGDTNTWMDVFVHDLQTGQTSRASLSSSGAEANDDCHSPSLSEDGQWVVFASYAANLTGASGNYQGIYLRDLQANVTSRVSESTSGNPGNADSEAPDVSADGRFVVFSSYASTLVAGDSNNVGDVFVRDCVAGTTARVSVDSFGTQGLATSRAPSISGNGQWVAFESDANNLTQQNSFATDIFVHDMTTGSTTIVNLTSEGYAAQDGSGEASISGDGRYVAFATDDDGMVPDDTNGVRDILVHEASHHMEASGPARIGQSTTLYIKSPRDAGKVYVALAAENTQFGIRLGSRLFPLDNDALLQGSTGMPSVFQNFIGTLDMQGEAIAYANIPNQPALLNLEFVTAYTVLDASFPTEFLAMSNALPFLIQQ